MCTIAIQADTSVSHWGDPLCLIKVSRFDADKTEWWSSKCALCPCLSLSHYMLPCVCAAICRCICCVYFKEEGSVMCVVFVCSQTCLRRRAGLWSWASRHAQSICRGRRPKTCRTPPSSSTSSASGKWRANQRQPLLFIKCALCN